MSESKAKNNFRILKNELKNYDRRELCIEIINKLKTCDTLDQLEKPLILPWHLIYLLKLTVQYSGFNPTRLIHNNDLYRLLNLVKKQYDFFNKNRKKDSITGYSIISTSLQQQRVYQENLNYIDYGINIIIFKKMTDSKSVSDWFEKEIGVNPIEYYIYSFIIFAWRKSHLNYKTLHSDGIKIAILGDDGKEKFDRLYNYLKIDLPKMRQELINSQKRKDIFLLPYEEPPFFRYPILRIKGKDFLVSDQVYFKTIRMLLFDSIKRNKNSKVRTGLSNAFEFCISKLLDTYNHSYITENELKKKYSGKVTDFLIRSTDGHVMIEAKSIDAKVKVMPTEKELIRSYDNNIIKALRQIYSLLKNIKKSDTNSIYAIVLTYDELYFDTFQTILTELFIRHIQMTDPEIEINTSKLPYENIFYIQIRQLPLILEYCRINNITLNTYFKKLQINKDKSNMLENINVDFLMNEFNNLMNPYLEEFKRSQMKQEF